MKKFVAAFMISLIALPGLGRCYGSFGLTRVVYDANGSISHKWIRWIIFLVLIIFPVYEVAMLIDVIVLNSIEFWTGSRVVDADYDENGEAVTVVQNAGARAVITHRNFGERMDIDLYNESEVKTQLVAFRDMPGKFFVRGEEGLKPLSVDVLSVGAKHLVVTQKGNESMHLRSMDSDEYAVMKQIESDLVQAHRL